MHLTRKWYPAGEVRGLNEKDGIKRWVGHALQTNKYSFQKKNKTFMAWSLINIPRNLCAEIHNLSWLRPRCGRGWRGGEGLLFNSLYGEGVLPLTLLYTVLTKMIPVWFTLYCKKVTHVPTWEHCTLFSKPSGWSQWTILRENTKHYQKKCQSNNRSHLLIFIHFRFSLYRFL